MRWRSRIPKLLIAPPNVIRKATEYIRRKPTYGSRQCRSVALISRRRNQQRSIQPTDSTAAARATTLCISHGKGRNSRKGDSAMRTGRDVPSLKADPPIWLFLVIVSAS